MVATTTSLRWRSIIPVQPSLILYVVVVLVAIAIFYLNPFSSTSYCAKSQIPSHMPFTIFLFHDSPPHFSRYKQTLTRPQRIYI